MKPMRILSIDGGGIRGIIPGQVLVSLEKKLQEVTGDPSRRIADAFDLVAGTSTGGILTCIYLCPDAVNSGRPRFSAAEAVDLYLKNGGAIFDSPLWKEVESLGGIVDEKYRAAPLEKLLQQYLGDLRLSQLVKPCLVTSYDIVRRAAKLFNSADIAEEGAAREFHLRDVARATSAAPTYFEPAHIRAFDRKEFTLVDGGVFANNPAMCACVEAFKLRPELGVTDLRVMSLGTGSADKPYKYEEAKNWGKLQWALPVLNILMSGVAETVDFQLRILFKAAQCPGQYLRVEANLNKFDDVDSAMDNASPVNMEALKQIGNTLAEDNEKALTEWAKTLMEAS